VQGPESKPLYHQKEEKEELEKGKVPLITIVIVN
jgi:hypothetical protein